MQRLSPALWLAGIACAVGCGTLAAQAGETNPDSKPKMNAPETAIKPPIPPTADSIVIAGGCFWCVEALFDELKGVYEAESGYAGGTIKNPTYKQVVTGGTGHAEVVRIWFDPKAIDAEDLLRIFFTTHDPTQLNRQGNDIGTQYRSAVFFRNEAEKARAQKIIDEITAEKLYEGKIVTTLEPLTDFYIAEDYHQDYFVKFEKATPEQRAQMNSGYCSVVVAPKVQKFREKYREKLEKKG